MSAQKSKELRRLFSITKQQRQQQQEVVSSSPQSSDSRIIHPYAKYDDSHKLVCMVCSVNIKNESLWNSHLVSSSHKETLRKLKEIKGALKESSDSAVSKAMPSVKSPTIMSTFKPKSILKKESGFNDLEKGLTTTENKKRSVGTEGKITISGSTSNVSSGANADNIMKSLIGYEDGDEDEGNSSEEEEEKVSEQVRVKRVKYSDDSLTTEHIIESIPQISTSSDDFDSQMSVEQNTLTVTSKLPSDFFDDTEAAASAINQQINSPIQETEIAQQQESTLPADFFDDPSLNHSSTKVSITSEIDEQEWINFQKEISKETQVSNQIANADDEQLQKDRDEMQEREQEICLARLERLKSVAKHVKENRSKHMTIDDDTKVKNYDSENIDDTEDEDIDDDFVNGWMDWRAQKIL